MKKIKEQLLREIKTTRNFSYSKDGVTLNFSLNLDNLKELKAFQSCLEKALLDVTDSLK